jgi:hypothetical protein
MPQVDDFRTRVLQYAAHDIYGGIMTIEKGGGSDNPDVIIGFVDFNHVVSFGECRMSIDDWRILEVASLYQLIIINR